MERGRSFDTTFVLLVMGETRDTHINIHIDTMITRAHKENGSVKTVLFDLISKLEVTRMRRGLQNDRTLKFYFLHFN